MWVVRRWCSSHQRWCWMLMPRAPTPQGEMETIQSSSEVRLSMAQSKTKVIEIIESEKSTSSGCQWRSGAYVSELARPLCAWCLVKLLNVKMYLAVYSCILQLVLFIVNRFFSRCLSLSTPIPTLPSSPFFHFLRVLSFWVNMLRSHELEHVRFSIYYYLLLFLWYQQHQRLYPHHYSMTKTMEWNIFGSFTVATTSVELAREWASNRENWKTDYRVCRTASNIMRHWIVLCTTALERSSYDIFTFLYFSIRLVRAQCQRRNRHTLTLQRKHNLPSFRLMDKNRLFADFWPNPI